MATFEYITNGWWDEYGDPTLYDLCPGGPRNAIAIVAGYLLIVLVIGPRMMKNRPAYDLSSTIKVYNLVNIVLNMAIFLIGMKATNLGLDCFRCDTKPAKFDQMILGGGYYYLKIFDLLDTVFFVLRKKDRQVTTLHVAHHATMPLLTWIANKFYPYAPLAMTLLLNSFVHMLMYAYYYLASVPEYKRFLWWKKYITVIQLVQFLIIFVQTMVMIGQPCLNTLHRVLACVGTSFLLYMIYSFSMFYYKSYVKVNRSVEYSNEIKKSN